MTDQVLLDEFKELIDAITLEVMQDIIKNQMSEEMISGVISQQTTQSIKAFEEELPKQVEKVIQTIESELDHNYIELLNKAEEVIGGSIGSFKKEIPRQVRVQVAELITSELNFNYLELSSRIEQFQRAIIEQVNEKAKTTLGVVQEVQEEQKLAQEKLQEQTMKLETALKFIGDIKTLMKGHETARKEERKQDLAGQELQTNHWEKRFKMLMYTQGATILLLIGSLVYMVSK